MSVTTHVLYYECGWLILLMKVQYHWYTTTVCANSMYVIQYVCMFYVYLLLLCRVCVLVLLVIILCSF